MSFTKFHYTKDKVKCQENGSCIVTMNKKEILMFNGYVRIQVKKGKVEINGYIIDTNNNNDDEANYFDLYSIPYWKHNCLSIKSITKSQIQLHPFDFVSKYQIKQLSKTNTPCDSVFNVIGCTFLMNEYNEYKPLLIPLSWQKSTNYFVQSSNIINSTIMICGRIQSGKSTFSRYLINCLLNKYSQIAYLDCDIGQSEFNPQGMISITIIKQPLFGPAHTHQHYMENNKQNYQCWKAYYYGSNNAMDNPEFYLQCITKLYSDWIRFLENNNNENIPLIINTLGWTKNLGSNILKSLIVNLSPNHLIEIYNKNEPLFGGVEMDYLAEVKQMFIHQNKIHNWCDNHYKYKPINNQIKKKKNNSLVSSWWKQLTTTDEFAVKQYQQLKPTQKKWFKHLDTLVELKFESDDDINVNNNNTKWYNNINVTKSKQYKTNQEIQLFKAFINTHIHYVESVVADMSDETTEINDDVDMKDESIHKMMKLRMKRQKGSVQKRLLSMISYFTQQLFLNKPAKYLREIDCYKISFNEISVMFLEQMDMNNENKSLILHALNGVIVGLGVINNKLDDNILQINQPPLKKRKFNAMNSNNYKNNSDIEWDLDVIDMNDYGNDIECVGLGIIRSINVKKQLFYLITPVCVSELNKVNLFIRGRTRIPSMLIYDESILTPPLYINSTPVKERILKTTC